MQKKKKLGLLVAVVLIAVLAISYAYLTSPATGPGPVEIQVTSDKQSYLSGENITFSIYVNNPHDWQVQRPGSINYTITDSLGQVVHGAYPQILWSADAHYFPSHSQTSFGYHKWNQFNENSTLVSPGDFTLTVALSGPADYGQPGNCTITILAPA